MFDYLVNHAIKNAWCTPGQDRQAIVRLAKITPFDGVWNYFTSLWRQIALPIKTTKFHVYQVGQLYPNLMGLFETTKPVWTTLAEACNKESLIVDVYTNKGIQLPRSQIWYMYTEDKNLIIAVKNQSIIRKIDLNVDDLFIRVYSNAYFNSEESSPLNDFIKVSGKAIELSEDIISIQQEMINHSQLPGKVYGFVNGYYVDRVTPLNTKKGDVVEYVYDSSVYKVVDLPISALNSFVSTMDKKHKYLIHYPEPNRDVIDYFDDVDFFIIEKQQITNNVVGVYYHKNLVDAVRILTHKDYSLTVPYVAGYLDSRDEWTNIDNLFIRLHIRKSGYERELVDENSRIKELYKLPDDRLVGCMLGVNSNVNVWKAEVLEESYYPKLMGARLNNINRDLVEKAYGYNAISKLIADTPKKTMLYSGTQIAMIPYSLVTDSVVYEYDDEGVLFDYFNHVLGSTYTAYSDNTRLVEMINGIGGLFLDEYVVGDEFTIDPKYTYRVYSCGISSGVLDYKWKDITGTDKYSIVQNKIVWELDVNFEYPVIRTNKNILTYDIKKKVTDGLLRFDLIQNEETATGTVSKVMQIPMGELDIFLNGRGLIEGLDYIVEFPSVTIINKKYLDDPLNKQQRISIRFSGFCSSDMTRNVTQDKGFVKCELLSHNNRFDLRDDKVLRIVVDGKLYDRSELMFSEEDAAVLVPNALNGVPYSIRDIIVPYRGLADTETYTARAASLAIDKSISDYMTVWLPERKIDIPNVIESLYEVYSPFCAKILFDLKNFAITDPRIKDQYSDADVYEICKPYEYLLEVDPTQFDPVLDTNYVVIHPHHLTTVVEVDIYTYKFIKRVIKLYLKNSIDISHFVNISTF